MAKNSQTVMDFLNNLWGYSLENAKKEAAELQKIMDKEGKGEKLAAWDWWYYAEKLRQEKYDLNEDEIDDLLSKLNNDWDGENDDCQAYSFNTTMFHPNVYYLQFQSF